MLVEMARIAGTQPFPVERRRGCVAIVPVAPHHAGSANLDLAGISCGDGYPAALTTRTDMPSCGRPTVPPCMSGGSSGSVPVMLGDSVIGAPNDQRASERAPDGLDQSRRPAAVAATPIRR